MSLIQRNAVVLFQGDSVTDCGRSREKDGQLGGGYANMIASWFSALYPELGVTFLNRGISGNRVADLQRRWVEDCLALKPTWLSVLIGINDCWRRYDSNDATSTGAYEDAYRDILARAVAAGINIIVMEPFVLPYPPDRAAWREDLDPKIDAARRLAREFNAILVPTDGLFAAFATRRPAEFWAADGVHPSQEGHALMAQAWLRAVRAI